MTDILTTHSIPLSHLADIPVVVGYAGGPPMATYSGGAIIAMTPILNRCADAAVKAAIEWKSKESSEYREPLQWLVARAVLIEIFEPTESMKVADSFSLKNSCPLAREMITDESVVMMWKYIISDILKC